MHVADGDRTVEIFSRPAVPQAHFSVPGDGHALPQFPVVPVVRQILQDLRKQFVLMLRLELLPLQIDIIVGQIQSVHDIILVGAVENRRGHVEAKGLRRQGQVNLQHLPDVHTGRHAQGIQHDVQGTAVGQIGHILHRKHTGDHTLVAVAACHLVAYGNLSLLGYIDADCLIHAGRELIAVLPGEHFCVHYDAIFPMGNLQGGIAHLSRLLAEDSAQQPLFRGQLRLSLGRDLAHQDVSRVHLRTDADDASVVQILQGVIAHAGHVPGNLLRPQLGISGLRLILFDVDGSIHVILHQALAQQHGVLVVVSLPCHEADQRVLAQSQLAHGGGGAVRDDLAFRHTVALEHDGLLVVAVGLVASGELGQVELFLLTVIIGNPNRLGRHIVDSARFPGNDTDAGVHSGLRLHARAYHRRFRGQKRHSLALHVGTHQGTVGIVVLQERNQRRRHGEDHPGRNVHIVEHGAGVLGSLLPITAGHAVADKMSFRVQGLTCLGHMVIVLFVRSHIYHLLRDHRILRVGFIHLSVRRFNESVFIYPGIACQVVDQTDVRAFRGLYGAHPPVMGIMHVTHLESRTVSGQTAGAQSGETPLVGQLGQRVVLVHELGQLGGTEEFLHRSRHRLDIDQGLGRNLVRVMGGHALAHHPLHPGQADAVLVLQKLSHGADAPVAQMVDVIVISKAILQMHVVIDGGDDVLLGHMFGNQLMHILLDGLRQLLRIVGEFFQNLGQHRIIHLLTDAEIPGVTVHIGSQVHHHVGKDFDVLLLCLDIDEGNRSILNGIRQLHGHFVSRRRQDLACGGIHHVRRQDLVPDAVPEGQLLVELISAHLGQVISAGVEEHGVDQALRALHAQRLPGTDFLVQL